MGNLDDLQRVLRRVHQRYNQPLSGDVPLYLTEFGYQTNPPDRFGVSWARQRAYLAQAEYIAFRNAGVRTLSQFLLDPDSTIPMVGASGAIAGVMGAYLVLYPHSRVLMLFPFPVFLFELPAVAFLGIWFFVQFLNGVGQLPIFQQDQISGGVAFWAHVAGFAAGVVLVVFMRRPERQRVEWWDTIES